MTGTYISTEAATDILARCSKAQKSRGARMPRSVSQVVGIQVQDRDSRRCDQLLLCAAQVEVALEITVETTTSTVGTDPSTPDADARALRAPTLPAPHMSRGFDQRVATGTHPHKRVHTYMQTCASGCHGTWFALVCVVVWYAICTAWV